MARSNHLSSRRRALLLALAGGACVVAPATTRAADFWWRGDFSSTWSETATILGGIVNSNFATDSNGLFDRFALPGALDVVRFAPSNASNLFTTLGTNFAIDGLTTEFSLAGNVSIGGANTLTIGSSGIVLGASRVMTISSGLATTTSGHFINTANGFSELNLNGSISASPIAKSGAGLLRITGNSQATSIAIDGGTVRLGSAAGYRTNTPLTITAGTFDLGGFSATVSNLRFGTGASGGPRNIINSVAGSAAITLNGSLTYTGPGAAAIVSAPIIFSPGQHIIENTGGVFSDAFYDIVLDGALSGTGGFTKRGSAYLALTRRSTHSGPTIIENGRVYAAADTALSADSDLTVTSPGLLFLDPTTSSAQVTAGSYFQSVRSLSGNGAISVGFGILEVSGPATTTYSGVISGFGTLQHGGTGKLTLTGANTYANETRISGGTVEIGNGGTTGSVVGTINLFGGSVIFNRSDDVTFGGNFSGGGSITKVGAGTLTLGGNSGGLRGAFFVSQGTLTAGANTALGDRSNITVGTADAPATARLNTGGFAQNIGDLLLYSRASSAQTAVDVGTGTLTIEGEIRVLNTTVSAGDNFSTIIAAGAGGKIQLPGSGGGSDPQASITVAGQNLGSANDLEIQPVITGFSGLNITANPSTLNGARAGVMFSAPSPNTYQGTTTVNAGILTVNSTTSLGVGNLVLNTTGDVATDVRLANAAQTVRQLRTGVVGTAVPTLVLTGTELTVMNEGDFNGVIAGTGSLVVDGFSELTLRRANTYSGVTRIDEGTLILAGNGSISVSSAVNVTDNGFLQFNRSNTWGNHATTTSSPITIAANGSVQSNNTFTTLVNLTLNGGTLRSNGGQSAEFPAFALKGTVVVGGSQASTIEGFSGFTAINIGTTASPGSTTFNVADSTGNADGDLIISVPLQNNRNDANTAAQASGLVKTGAGTLVLAADNSYTGGTTISAGTLRIGDNFGSSGSVVGNIVNNALLVFAGGSESPYSGSISGSGNLEKTGGGTLILSGTSTYTGTTTINGGTIEVATTNALPVNTNLTINNAVLALSAPQTLSSPAGSGAQIQNNSVLTFNQATNADFGGSIIGSGSVVKAGAGTLTFSGQTSHNGGTTIRGGSLRVGATGLLPQNGDITVAQGNLHLGVDAVTNVLSLGDAVLTGSRTLTGEPGVKLIVLGGIRYIGKPTAPRGEPGLVQVPIVTPSFDPLIFSNPSGNPSNFAYDLILSRPVSGENGITKDSANLSVALTETNTYTGPTIVNAGNLHLAKTNSLPSSTSLAVNGGQVILNPTVTGNGVTAGNYSQTVAELSGAGGTISLGSATLTVNQSTTSTFAGRINGTGSFVKSGPGPLTLSGTNTHTGGTAIRGGSLAIAAGSALPAGQNVTVAVGNLHLAASATVGDLAFGDGVLVGARSVTGTPGSTLTVNGKISYVGTSPRSDPGLIQVPVSLPAGQHLLDNPNDRFSTGQYDLVFSKPISGNGGITLQGNNLIVALTETNSYTGPTIVNTGILFLGKTNSLPVTTSLQINGGTVLLNPGTTENGVTAGNFSQTVGALSGTGGAIVLGSATLTMNQSLNTTFAGEISGGGSVVKSGLGTLNLSGNLAYTGNTTVSGGTLILGGSLNTGGGDVLLSSNGKIEFARARAVTPVVVSQIDQLTVPSGSTAKVTLSTRTGGLQQGVLIVNRVSITGGFVDLTNNDLIVRNQSVGLVRELVGIWSRSAGGLPGVVGLGSSEAFYTVGGAFATLGVYDNSIAGQTLLTYEGIPVQSTDVIVKYTYVGDTNIDGVVDAADLARLLRGMQGQGSGWNFGDVDHNGVVNFVDLGRTMAALRGQGAPLGGSGLGGGGVIPEPSAAGVLVGGVVLFGRRRRR